MSHFVYKRRWSAVGETRGLPPPADFQKAIDLNLMSPIHLVYAFLPFMKRQKWGRVLASAPSNVRHLLPMFPLSNVSRMGVVAFIKTLAVEFGRWNITANVLAPGLFMTEPTKGYLEDQARQEGIPYQEALEKLARISWAATALRWEESALMESPFSSCVVFFLIGLMRPSSKS